MKRPTSALQEKLARSLDAANRREKKRPGAPGLDRPEPPPATEEIRRCTKLSISLFDADMARLEAIRDFMAKRGARLSVSQAIKIALRAVPLSADMDAALAAIRAEDGRKW